ncbi:MAG: Cof-type HAD-IIB family hydrolase [Caldibacillus sp.]
MKDRYLIALDLDGTLLRDDKTISAENKKVLKQAREEGHVVMIATGRSYRTSELYYKELKLDTPIVNYNGAFIHHPRDKKWGSYHEPIRLETVQKIVESCFQYNFHNIIAEVLDHVYIHYHDQRLLDIFRLGNPQITEGDLRKFLKQNPTSLLIQTDDQNVGKLSRLLEERHGNDVEHRSWGYPYPVIEVNKKGINKAFGIKKVADYYGIPRERIIAFGDEDNDLEMLEYAEYGVAMGNAIDKAKEVAKDVTLTNEEDGIAHYLKKTILA